MFSKDAFALALLHIHHVTKVITSEFISIIVSVDSVPKKLREYENIMVMAHKFNPKSKIHVYKRVIIKRMSIRKSDFLKGDMYTSGRIK